MPKAQVLRRSLSGLHLDENPFSRVPEGSLAEAENVNIERDGKISKRRGFARRHALLDGTPVQVFEYKNAIHVQRNDGQVRFDNGATFSVVGTFNRLIAGELLRSVEVQGSLYITSADGVVQFTSLGDQLGTAHAGVPAGLDLSAVPVDGTIDWLQANTQVSYRVVWMRMDTANMRELRGAPSVRGIATQSGGDPARDVDVSFTVPDEITTEDWYEIYRTTISANASTDPGDEHFLIDKKQPTSAEITAKVVVYRDQLDPSFLGVPLYTNPTQETITQENSRPPIARDITHFRGHLFYAQTQQPHQLVVALKSVTNLTNDVSTVTIAIAGGASVTLIGSASESIPAAKFRIAVGGPTTADNIRTTARSFVRVLNRLTSNASFYAHYISGADDPPGIILIVRRALTVDAASFALTANSTATGGEFTPLIPTSGVSLSSDDEDRPNALYRSKFEIPEAVPRLNFDLVGAANRKILRILAIRDSLIILKEDGIFRLSGDTETSFDIAELDPSVRIIFVNSACVLNNAVYAWCNQGICRITESGVVIVSRAIERMIERIAAYSGDLDVIAFPYESERKYILSVQELESDNGQTVALVYDHIAREWTLWRKSIACGHVALLDDILHVGSNSDQFVLRERKSMTANLADFEDEDKAITVSAIGTDDTDGDYVEATISGFASQNPEEGDRIDQGALSAHVLKSLSLGSNVWRLFIADNDGWMLTSATYTFGIRSRIRWTPEAGDNPLVKKQWPYFQVYSETDAFTRMQLSFLSDASPNEEDLDPILIEKITGTGQAAQTSSTPLRVPVPLECQRSRSLSPILEHRRTRETFDLTTIAYTVREYGDRTNLVSK
jgi:hypothetical protein